MKYCEWEKGKNSTDQAYNAIHAYGAHGGHFFFFPLNKKQVNILTLCQCKNEFKMDRNCGIRIEDASNITLLAWASMRGEILRVKKGEK